MQRAGCEASDWKERVGQGSAEQNLPAVRSQREWLPISGRDRQGRARRSWIGCECGLGCRVCFGWWLVRLRGALRDGSGAFQMQACDHEGVPSGERGPQGDCWACFSLPCCIRGVFSCAFHFPLPHSTYQGGGEKDDDYVTRIEFRLLLVGLAADVCRLYAPGVIAFGCRCISSNTSSCSRSLTTLTPGLRPMH